MSDAGTDIARDAARKAEIDATFAEAEKVKIADVISRFVGALKWSRSGQWLRGACPLCGAGRKGSSPFAVNTARNRWYCHAEGEGGDGIEIVVAKRGTSRLEAARLITNWTPGQAPAPRDTAAETTRQAADEMREAAHAARRAKFIAELIAAQWRGAVAAAGSPVEAWFARRGLDPVAIPGAFDRLRFHPDALVAAGRFKNGEPWEVRAPAMVAQVHAWRPNLGAWLIVGQHCTYLTPSGHAKAKLFGPDGKALPARKIWGPYHGGAVLLTDMIGEEPLVTGEGIETVWAWAGLNPAQRGARFAASLSLDNFCGRPLKDAGRAFDPALPRRDPAHDGFVFPDAGSVIGLVDRDMSPVEVKARNRFKRIERRSLTQDDRARIAASLFKQQWMAAGATEAAAVFPPAGMDFNDQLMAERAR